MRPGINKDQTEYLAEGGWVDCDHIRWRNGRPEKIGGWVRETAFQFDNPTNQLFTGVAREVLAWIALDGRKFLAVGTHRRVELFAEGRIFDITPLRDEDTVTNVITTINGDIEVSIYYPNHNVVVGDGVHFGNQQSAVDGITLDGTYIVVGVTDLDNFTVNADVAASGSTSGGGGDIDIGFLLEDGYQSNGDLTGWGGGTWGTPGQAGQGYNRPRAGVGGANLRLWSFDIWGEDMVANVRGGKIYHWDRTNGETVRLQEITNAPDQNSFILVSQPSRHLIAFGSEIAAGPSAGTFDPLIIRWASQETLDQWTITTENSAGEYRLPKGNYIVGAVQTAHEIIVFTNSDVYSMRYVGGNDIFNFTPLGTNISAVSPNSFIDVNGVIYWMGVDAFYMYDGVVRQLPSTLGKYLFDQDGEGRLNFDQKEKVYVGINKEFNEVIWFYPALTSPENDKYVKYNFAENLWDVGTMERTVWFDRSVFPKPYALDTTGVLYIQETGKNADGGVLSAFVRTAFFDIEDGEMQMFIDRIIPDIRLPVNGGINITVVTKKYPHPTASRTTKGPFLFTDTQNKLSLRARGRQASIQFGVNSTGSDFEIGKIRIGVQPDGER